MILIGLVVLVLAALALGAIKYGQARWLHKTNALRSSMQVACKPSSVKTYDARETDMLPAPVKRYFSAVLQEGQTMITSVSLLQQGVLRLSEKKDRWQPFEATQFATMRPPGFDWDARIRIAPGLAFWVRDCYALGAGFLHAAVLGLVTVADMHDDSASTRGELMRYPR